MPGSYEKINYGIRPAKSVERKMLCDAFRKLSEFGRVDAYRYVGFGSTYFTDFCLFHKNLGITNMISIEQDEFNKERFLFNRPFNCIELRFGKSGEVIPLLNWDMRTIAWLDYDGSLESAVLEDIDFICRKANPGSLIIVSVNAHPDKPQDDRIALLKERVGDENIPLGISDDDLSSWNLAGMYRRIVKNTIEQALNDRNGALQDGNKIKYKQLFNFHYADGAKMLTTGGLIYDEGQDPLVAKCAFENLPFIRFDEDVYKIDIPNLTYKEIRHID